ncbi:hypothetical protein [Thermomonospora umbrina]|uniref:TROVE domain-containing protein n=1 Tax=Thermomonospora umbrina TaxID=111806 RepID=A0A3D9SRJ4_9ACTN|nr:hypothetical protein [Thermomonospora umbrina]REE98552.1 hypothetical protein DFJ69_4042 [Thermomonospora umbrina]
MCRPRFALGRVEWSALRGGRSPPPYTRPPPLLLGPRPPAGAAGRREAGPIEELFRTALSNVGFRDALFRWPGRSAERYAELVHEATRKDPEWTACFLRWLRTATPMRYPALVGAAAFVRERLDAGAAGMSRQVVASVLRRADDPGHLLAHWVAVHGRPVPKPLKRGIADAVTLLYDDRALLMYDTGAHHLALPRFAGVRAEDVPHPFRFGDVIAMTHPNPRDRHQAAVFAHALNRRRTTGRTERIPPPPSPHTRRDAAEGDEPSAIDRERLTPSPRRSTVSAHAPQRRRTVAAEWERLLPSMSLPDVVARLRHFDRAGISFESAMGVAARLSDADEVRASGLSPLRLVAAGRSVARRRWAPFLEGAAAYALDRLPTIPGRTLILIDHGADADAVFGLTLAQRCEAPDVITGEGEPFEVLRGESPLHGLIRWRSADLPYDRSLGYGAVGGAFAGHDRVVIIDGHVPEAFDAGVPDGVPVYAWQTRHLWRAVESRDPLRPRLHGLCDAAFSVIPLLEGARHGGWPF